MQQTIAPTSASPLRAPADTTVRRVYPLISDLLRARPVVYYADVTVSAALGWGSLVACARLWPRPWAWAAFAMAAVALYRAALFVHELTHLRPDAVPGLDTYWNLVVGIPLLLPSMLYVGGVHSVHHAKGHYGTPRDPEYLPIGWWPGWKRWAWVAHAALLPVALVLRFLVLAPLSLLHPRIRRVVWERASSLSVNPGFVRGPPPRDLRPRFVVQESLCFAWAAALAVLLARGKLSVRTMFFAVLVAAAVGVVNQLRTLVAHRFLNASGETLDFEQQFRDSVNVTGNRILTTLWAPVGLRYHALHHLLPGVPYHALGAAHRRIVAALPGDAAYSGINEESLWSALANRAPQKPPKLTDHMPS